jgi:hypothetical protein
MYKFDQSSSIRLKYALGEIFDSDSTDAEIDQWKLENHYQLLESTEELHAFAAQFNWDGNLNELYWVISHKVCDLATAKMIYWKASPLYFYEKFTSREEFSLAKPSYYADKDWFKSFDLIKFIEQKFDNQFFQVAKLGYSIQKDENMPQELEDYQKLLAQNALKQPIHPVALEDTTLPFFTYEIDWSATKK